MRSGLALEAGGHRFIVVNRGVVGVALRIVIVALRVLRVVLSVARLAFRVRTIRVSLIIASRKVLVDVLVVLFIALVVILNGIVRELGRRVVALVGHFTKFLVAAALADELFDISEVKQGKTLALVVIPFVTSFLTITQNSLVPVDTVSITY